MSTSVVLTDDTVSVCHCVCTQTAKTQNLLEIDSLSANIMSPLFSISCVDKLKFKAQTDPCYVVRGPNTEDKQYQMDVMKTMVGIWKRVALKRFEGQIVLMGVSH